jgi:hypothetical protein
MRSIANVVEGLDPPGGVGVELQLGRCHGDLPVRFLIDVEDDRYRSVVHERH